MKIHKNLWAGYETYFVRMGTSGRYATGINVANVDGDWRVDFKAIYYASDLRHDKEHFPVVGNVDIKAVVKDAILKAVEPKRGNVDKIGNAQFRVMCDLWGVDSAIKVAKRMGMAPTQEQIAEATQRETAMQERWNRLIKKELGMQHERVDQRQGQDAG